MGSRKSENARRLTLARRSLDHPGAAIRERRRFAVVSPFCLADPVRIVPRVITDSFRCNGSSTVCPMHRETTLLHAASKFLWQTRVTLRPSASRPNRIGTFLWRDLWRDRCGRAVRETSECGPWLDIRFGATIQPNSRKRSIERGSRVAKLEYSPSIKTRVSLGAILLLGFVLHDGDDTLELLMDRYAPAYRRVSL